MTLRRCSVRLLFFVVLYALQKIKSIAFVLVIAHDTTFCRLHLLMNQHLIFTIFYRSVKIMHFTLQIRYLFCSAYLIDLHGRGAGVVNQWLRHSVGCQEAAGL